MGVLILTNEHFSPTHYIETLRQWEKNGYAIKPVNKFNPKKTRQLVLRHDVDVSLSHALVMANLESDNGIKSTYCILLHSEFYNPLALQDLNILKQISENHEIGLHYDLAALSSESKKARNIIKNEIKLLSKILDSEITTISIHNPVMGESRLHKTIKLFFNDSSNLGIKYVTDSGRNWREECFCQYVGKFENIQVLIHPLHWILNETSYESGYKKFEKSYYKVNKKKFEEMYLRRERYIRRLKKEQKLIKSKKTKR